MPLIKCPNCGRDISDKAKKCIGCGYVLAMSTYSSNVINNELANSENVPTQNDYILNIANNQNTQQNNGNSSLTQEKILAFSKLMQDGIITPDELTKIMNALSSDSNVVTETKSPFEKKYDECFSNHIIQVFKSPSTCKWPPLKEDMIKEGTVKILEGWSYVPKYVRYIETYIDAANSYGAMLRKQLRIVINEEGDPQLVLEKVTGTGLITGALLANSDDWAPLAGVKL